MRNVLVITFMLITEVTIAGDIATERTQAATAAIVSLIRETNESIRYLEEEISLLEQRAASVITESPGYDTIPGVDEFFTILGGIEEVIEEGEALAHTYDGLEQFMEERFDDYDTYLAIITEWGELDEEGMREKFRVWSKTHMDTITQTLHAHGIHADQLDTAEARLQVLQAFSRNAQGRMQAIQIGHEIATEEIKQLHQLKEIIMEQSNLHASYFAVRQAMRTEREAANAWIQREIYPTIVGNEQGLPLPGLP